MALGKRYTFGFYDRQGRHITAEIHREGFTGTAEAVAKIGKPAVVKTIGKPTDYVLEPIKASTVVVQLLKSEILQYLNFFSSDFKNSRLDLYIDSVLWWRGWCLPDIYGEPFLQKTVALSFVDGLNLLKDVDYDQTGTQTLWDIITYCIDFIGLDLPVYSGCSIREDSISATTSVEPLDQITFDADNYADKKYLEVLSEVLEKHGLRIYQQNAAWIIEQIGDKVTGETLRKYNSSFVYQSVETQDNLITPPQTSGGIVQFLAKSANIEMIPGWKKFQLTDDYGLKDSIVNNSDFDEFTQSGVPAPFFSADFDDWAGTPDTFIIIQDDKFCMVLESLNESDPGNYTASHYIYSSNAPTLVASSGQNFSVKFGYYIFGSSGNIGTGINLDVYVMIKCGSNYATAEGTWTTTETLINLGDIETERLTAGLTRHEFKMQLSSVVAGQLEIRFYRPLKASTTTYYMGITELRVMPMQTRGDSFPEKEQAEIIVNSNNNFEGDDKSFILTDVPVENNSVHMYNHAMKLSSDGSVTDNWNYQGLSGRLSDLFIYQIIQNYYNLKAKITGAGFFGDGVGFNNIFAISGLSTRRFMFTNYTHDLYRSTIEGAQLVELPFVAELSNASAYYFAQYGSSLLNLKGVSATVSSGYITFPNVANDIFNKQNTTFWQSGLTIHDSDPRKWAFSELTGTAVILYSTATCRARLFFRDYDGATIDTILPIMAFDTDRTEAQQQAIVDSFKEYFFITDGGFIIQDDGDYVVTD